jgi:lipoyl(octanoyl) transferase
MQVWIGDYKVAAIGVRFSQGVATHGLAINVATDLSWFDMILACGERNAKVTSMTRELGQIVPVDAVAAVLTQHLERQLQYQECLHVEWADLLHELEMTGD